MVRNNTKKQRKTLKKMNNAESNKKQQIKR